MAKPTSSVPKRKDKGSSGQEGVNPENIDEVEKETIDRANKALSALEVAIASWDAAIEKPERLKEKFSRYRKLHDALAGWEKRMLQSMGMKEDYSSRVSRLQEFVNICHTYS